jgi:hypothetical protein
MKVKHKGLEGFYFNNGLFTLAKFVSETVGDSEATVLALATLGSAL